MNSAAVSFNKRINLYPTPDFTLVLNCSNISFSSAATISYGNGYFAKIVTSDLQCQLAATFLYSENVLMISLSSLPIN